MIFSEQLGSSSAPFGTGWGHLYGYIWLGNQLGLKRPACFVHKSGASTRMPASSSPSLHGLSTLVAKFKLLFWQLNLRELQTKLPVFLKPKTKHTSWLSLHSLIKASQKGSTDSGAKKTDLPLDWKKNINVQQWEEFLTTIFRNGLPSVPIAPQFSSVTQSCPTLCDPIDCSTPGLPVHHHLLELAQTHVHRVSDAIQPSHPLSSPSPAFNLSQHQGLFKWVFASGGQNIGVSASASVLPVNIQDWVPLGWTGYHLAGQGTLKSLLQHHSSKASILRCSTFFIVQLSHPYMILEKP